MFKKQTAADEFRNNFSNSKQIKTFRKVSDAQFSDMKIGLFSFQYVERERCYGYRVTEMRRGPRACLALCLKSGSFEDFEHFISH